MDDEDDAHTADRDDDDSMADRPASPALEVIRQLISEANRERP